MIETAFGTSLSQIFEMSMPSILIELDYSSTRQNRAGLLDEMQEITNLQEVPVMGH